MALLNIMGVVFYLYWTTEWFDMITHSLAGLAVSLATLLFWQSVLKKNNLTRSQVVCIGVGGALAVGIVWELYELHFDITSLSDGIYYTLDTAKDIAMDTLGGLVGSIYAYKIMTETNI